LKSSNLSSTPDAVARRCVLEKDIYCLLRAKQSTRRGVAQPDKRQQVRTASCVGVVVSCHRAYLVHAREKQLLMWIDHLPSMKEPEKNRNSAAVLCELKKGHVSVICSQDRTRIFGGAAIRSFLGDGGAGELHGDIKIKDRIYGSFFWFIKPRHILLQ